MPKIFLIKNRLLQQQQRLLESSKHSPAVSILDETDNIEANEKLASPSIQQQLQQLQQPLFLKTNGILQNRDTDSRESVVPSGSSPSCPSSDDEEQPLSLVVNKG